MSFGGYFRFQILRAIAGVCLGEGLFKLREMAVAHFLGGALDPDGIALDTGGAFAGILNLLPDLDEQERPSERWRFGKPEVNPEDGTVNGVAAFADQPSDAEVLELCFHVYVMLEVQVS